MEILVSIKDGTRYHFVSIEFHEFEINCIITRTRKIFQMESKYYHALWDLSFIFHLKSVHCGYDFAVNLIISEVD